MKKIKPSSPSFGAKFHELRRYHYTSNDKTPCSDSRQIDSGRVQRDSGECSPALDRGRCDSGRVQRDSELNYSTCRDNRGIGGKLFALGLLYYLNRSLGDTDPFGDDD